MEYYISKKNFEVFDELTEFIPCDAEIASAIAKLNELGYETFACCAGHYNPGFYLYQDVPLSELAECQNDEHKRIIEIRDDGFDVWSERLASHVYVAFKEKYDFERIPEGFRLESFVSTSGYDDWTLEADVDYYDETGKMRRRRDVSKELSERQSALLEWAKTLPKNKEKGKVK